MAQLKSMRIDVRLTPAEHKDLKNAAKERAFTVSEFVRYLLAKYGYTR